MLATLLSRRSIRKFTPAPLSAGEMDLILRAGMNAPSARNARPWSFVVVDDPALLKALRESHPYAGALDTAPLAVLLCADPNVDGRFDAFWQQDCGACAENMLLAAHGQGLGGVWMGLYPNEERCNAVRAIFPLPRQVEPFCLLAFGHPAEEGARPDRFEQTRIHRNGW